MIFEQYLITENDITILCILEASESIIVKNKKMKS